MSILSDLNPFNPNSPLSLFPGPPTTPKQQQQGPTLSPGSNNLAFTQQQQQAGEQVVKAAPFGIGSAITSTNDFLNFISWIFHPLSWLRMAEFLVGLLFFFAGLRPYLRSSGSPTLASTGAGLNRIISATPAGRAMRIQQGRRMGTREGQREASRMQARREVTRSEREASARERHEREVRTRRAARSQNQ